MTIVASQKGHPAEFMFKPFSSPRWAKSVANFPAVKLEKPQNVTGLAAFLAEHIPATHRRRSTIVTCYAAEGSERELIRKQYSDRMAENIIKCYEVSETARAIIQDWDFGLLRHGQSPDDFWNEQARLMLAAGVEIVRIRAHVGCSPVEFKI